MNNKDEIQKNIDAMLDLFKIIIKDIKRGKILDYNYTESIPHQQLFTMGGPPLMVKNDKLSTKTITITLT